MSTVLLAFFARYTMKLSITTEHTVWCARCNQWEQQSEPLISKFQRKMRKGGWCIRKGETVCKLCAEELKTGNEWDDVGYRHSPS